MIYYFAGSEPTAFRQLLFEEGAKSILMSAYFLNYKTIPADARRFQIIMDSGGYTLRKNNLDFDIKTYIDFLNANEVPLAFNLDTNDFEQTKLNQKLLRASTKTKIIPIFHYSDFLKNIEFLDELVAEWDYIAIGGIAGSRIGPDTRRNFFDYVFKRTKDKVKVHGLGVTSLKELVRYPFYSVDGTSWLASVRYRSMAIFNNGCTRVFQKTGKKKSIERYHLIQMKNDGIMRIAAQNVLNLEAYVTRMWEKKGVKW
jgi:hypothetical protein